LVVIALQLLLALLSRRNGWELWELPWWTWLVPIPPEFGLIVALASIHRIPVHHRRKVAIALAGVMSIVNGFTLTALISSIVNGTERSGGQLLLKGLTVWATNVTAFGLVFWELDGKGPRMRRALGRARRDFQFPQMENPELVKQGERWQPHFVDYLYVSFTNSIAFSPTDAMPLSPRSKLLMLAESAVSALTVLLVAARAVNIFK
jgi:hypothetical protein